MLEFLAAAAVVFAACWIWVGGYLADFVVWLISKLTPSSSNETNLAYALAGIFFVLGIVVAMNTEGKAGSTLGGAVAGAGLYVAVRLPGKIRDKRAARAGVTVFEPEPPAAIQPPEPPQLPATATDPRTDAWAEVHNPATSAGRLASIVAAYPEFGRAILAHPNVYPDLRAWIEQRATSAPNR